MDLKNYRVINNMYVIPNSYINGTMLSKNLNGQLISYLKLKKTKEYIRYIDEQLSMFYSEMSTDWGIELIVNPKSVIVVRHSTEIPFEDVGSWLHPMLWFDFVGYVQPEIRFNMMKSIQNIIEMKTIGHTKQSQTESQMLTRQLNYCQFLSSHIRADFVRCLEEHLTRIQGHAENCRSISYKFWLTLQKVAPNFPDFNKPKNQLTEIEQKLLHCFENNFCGAFNLLYPQMDFQKIFDNSVNYLKKVL